MTRIRLSLLVITLACAASLSAADGISFVPPNPQSGQPFQLKIDSFWRDSCVPGNPRLIVYDKRVYVDFELTSGCLSVVSPWQQVIDVPPLAAGDYAVVGRLLDYNGPQVLFRLKVTVSGAPSGIQVAGFDASAGNRVVRIVCTLPDCAFDPKATPKPVVTFGNVPAEAVEVVSTREIDAVAPTQTHVTFVDVKVQGPGYSYVAPSAFTYVSLYDFEPFLVPIYTRRPVPGAYGSTWITELTLANLSDIYFDAAVDVFNLAPGCAGPCVLLDFPPHYADDQVDLTLPLTDSDTPPAAMFYVRRTFAPWFAAQLRIRDTSRQLETWGTEIPVVRGSRMGPAVTLLDVPNRDGFRDLLRLYMPDYVGCCAAKVTFSNNGGKVLASRTIALQHPNGSIGGLTPAPYIRQGSRQFPLQPAYAELDLSSIPELAGNDPIWIRAESLSFAKIWGFVSVTHDETQHVTTITPQ